MKRDRIGSDFKRGSGCFRCNICGKLTRDTGNGNGDCHLCPKCFEREGLVNEHNGGGHEQQPHPGCPLCKESRNTKKESMEVKDLFHPTFQEEYELAQRLGDKRFGGPCQHEQVKNGRCVNCLRKVVTSLKEVKPSSRTPESKRGELPRVRRGRLPGAEETGRRRAEYAHDSICGSGSAQGRD